MNYMMELATIAKAHGGIIENKIAAQHGITKAMLYNVVNNYQSRILKLIERRTDLQESIKSKYYTEIE